jgi:ATP-dependent DNA helicase RecG
VDADAFKRLVEQLRTQGSDDGRCEVKASGGGLGASVWDSISAFANTADGWVILGLDEDAGFAPAAEFFVDRVLDQFVEGIGNGGGPGRLALPPAYEIERHTCDGAPVLLIRIRENEVGSKPCYVRAKGVQGGSFKRVDDKDIKLSATEIFEMQRALSAQETDRTPVPEADLADLSTAAVDALLENKRDSKALRGAKTREEKLARLNVATKSGEVRLAGLLVAGVYPQQHFPRLLIDVAVHPYNEKSAPGSPIRFVDRVQCDGSLPEGVSQAVKVVARNLRTYSVVEGAARHDQLEIPHEVLREAIVNAVLHREYHELFRGQPVTVDVYPDRVVVTSPGGLWGGKTVDNLDDGSSRCRNQTLLQLLQSVPFPDGGGVSAEGQGGGIKLMIHEMESHALDRPRFRVTPDQVSVELRRHGAEVLELRAWLRSLTDRDLTHHEDAALVMARREGRVSVTMLRDDLRIDSDEAREVLSDLSSRGLLRPDGVEEYVLWGQEPELRGADLEVLNALSERVAVDIHTLAERTGRSPGSLRPVLRRLVGVGRVNATAPATSRNRKYLRAARD